MFPGPGGRLLSAKVRSSTVTTPECILFDLGSTVLDGTFDPLPGNVAILARSRNPHGVTPEQMQRVADQLDATIRPLKDASKLEVHIHMFQRLLFALVQIEPEGTPEELELCFWDAAVHWHPTDGVLLVLAELKSMGIRKGIVSNFAFPSSTISRELQRQGLLQHFDCIVSSADYGLRKPAKALFEVALLRAGCKAENTWYVGDAFETDVLGALGAGMVGVWFNPGRKSKPIAIPCVEIHDWSELPRLVG